MFNTITNIYVLIILVIVLAFELLISKLIGGYGALLWSVTISAYFLFVLYQVLMKMNEETEKNKIRNILFELMDTIEGIPIMNKNEKLVIKWDLIFKKLVDYKEFTLYDKVIKMKTSTIDYYANKYPSILKDDLVDFKETKYNNNLHSTIRSKKNKEQNTELEMSTADEYKRKLFIRDIKTDAVTISNYDSSIIVDVMIKDEHLFQESPESGTEPLTEYDGFSVWMAYENNKYNIVPRVIVHKKSINKLRWFIDHMSVLLECVQSIVDGNLENTLYVDRFQLSDYLQDMTLLPEPCSIITFKQVKNEELIFTGLDKDNNETTAYCEFKTGHNRFEVTLKSIERNVDDEIQTREIDKTVAIGSSFQPVITLLEKMPELIKNIELVINNQEINSIVIS